MLDLIRGSRGMEAAAPEAIRAAREAAGWTQEQLADAMGVLPVEVAAWEAGTVRISPYRAEVVRWCIQNAEYARGLAERDEACAWLMERRARAEALSQAGPGQAGWVERTLAAHRRDCPVCREAHALAGEPMAPELPRAPGVRAWLLHAGSGLPPTLRLPFQSLKLGLFAGGTLFFWAALARGFDSLFGGPGFMADVFGWQSSLEGFLSITLATAWLAFLYGALRPLGDRDPRLAGQVYAASVTVPGVLAWGMFGTASLADPALWLVTAIFSALLGMVIGSFYDPEIDGELDAPVDEARPDDGQAPV